MINNGLPLAHSLRNKCHLPSTHLPPETGRESMGASSDADFGDDADFISDANAWKCLGMMIVAQACFTSTVDCLLSVKLANNQL